MYPKSLLSRPTRATNRIRAIPARAQWWQSIVLTHRVCVHCGLDRLHTLGLLRSRNLLGPDPAEAEHALRAHRSRFRGQTRDCGAFMKIDSASVAKSVAGLLLFTAPGSWASDSNSDAEISAICTA